MGKLSNVVKPRVCLNCGDKINTDSKGLKNHFTVCCKESRKPVEATT